MAIKPVSLPSAGGLDYGTGDVRHLSPGDALDVPGISNPTRYLAERDNQLASKVNELVGAVNNQEQFVPLPVVRTMIPPNAEVVVINYRIPNGFESRILNAVVSAVPAVPTVELNVYYAASFGNNTGTAVVTTATEFTGGVQFYQTGEFIVTLKNTGSITLELAASVLLTLRPLGAVGTLLVGTVISGPPGPPGVRGGLGPQGGAGSGGAGTPGMIWKGPWMNATPYTTNDVVSFPLYGSITSSYICRITNLSATGVNDPQTDSTTTWNIVAEGGATGIGQQGPPGVILNSPTFSSTAFNGTFITGADFIAGATSADGYVGGLSSSTTYKNLPLTQTLFAVGTSNKSGILMGAPRLIFTGHGTVRLPSQADGAAFNYQNVMTACSIVDNGTQAVVVGVTGTFFGTTISGVSTGTTYQNVITTTQHAVSVSPGTPASDFVVYVSDAAPVKVALAIFGGTTVA